MLLLLEISSHDLLLLRQGEDLTLELLPFGDQTGHTSELLKLQTDVLQLEVFLDLALVGDFQLSRHHDFVSGLVIQNVQMLSLLQIKVVLRRTDLLFELRLLFQKGEVSACRLVHALQPNRHIVSQTPRTEAIPLIRFICICILHFYSYYNFIFLFYSLFLLNFIFNTIHT